MTDKKDPPATGILAGAHIQKRKDGPKQAERTDDPGPGRDDRSELEIEIEQAKKRDEKQ